MQALFFLDSAEEEPAEALDLYYKNFPPPKDIRKFFSVLARGVVDKQEEIDDLIEQFSSNWKLYRMSPVDRNVMRISVYEMLFQPDIPAQVSINEAIDIGKKFGTVETGAFVNGILDSIRKHLRPEGTPPT